jgi:hypothetical protein
LNLHFIKTEPKCHINTINTESQSAIQLVDERTCAFSLNPHLSVKKWKEKTVESFQMCGRCSSAIDVKAATMSEHRHLPVQYLEMMIL